jgi:hypothetical protein
MPTLLQNQKSCNQSPNATALQHICFAPTARQANIIAVYQKTNNELTKFVLWKI